MGLTFRYGNYRRRVTLGKRTIKHGEAAVIWNRRGQHREIIGPSLEYMWYSTINFLDRHCARPDQYLRILHRDGSISIVQGPAILFKNPVKHDKVEVHDALTLVSSDERVVVLRGTPIIEAAAMAGVKTNGAAMAESATMVGGDHGGVERHVVCGPAIFVPSVHEQVQEFSWSFGDSEGRGDEKKTIRVLKPAPLFISTSFVVSTKDGVSFKIDHSMKVALKDVEVLLQCATPDPLKDMRTALAAEMASIGNTLHSEDLLGSSASLLSRLSELPSFPGLVAAAAAVGFEVSSFCLGGLSPCASYQKQLDRVTKEENEWRRRQAKLEEEARHEESRLQLAKRRATEERAAEEAKQRFQLELRAAESEAELRCSAQQNNQVLEFLEQLHTKGGVDLTALLTSYKTLDHVPTERLHPVFRAVRQAPALQGEQPAPPPAPAAAAAAAKPKPTGPFASF